MKTIYTETVRHSSSNSTSASALSAYSISHKKRGNTIPRFLSMLTFIFSFFSLSLSAATFYISPNGSDNAVGDIDHPFATLNKAWAVIASGDIIYMRGGTYTFTSQQALAGKNGIAGNPIKVWAFPGESPVIALNTTSKGITLTGNYINFKGIEINGLTTLSGWTNEGNGIYSKAVTCESPTNLVTINGVNTQMGRYPNADAANSGYLTIDSHSGATSITDAALPSAPNWTGAELVVRRSHWVIDRSIITNHTAQTLTYTPYPGGDARTPKDNYGYFIQNCLAALDQTGEWYYNGTTMYIYNPGASVIKTSIVSDLFYAPNCNHLSFDNCAFTGGNFTNLKIVNSDFTTITNCSFNFSGKNAIESWVGGASDSLTVRNSTFNNTNNCAILLRENTNNVLIKGNTFMNTGIFQGMASKVNIDGSHEAIFGYKSSGLSILKNRIINTGYCGIGLYEDYCTNTIIKNNFIDTFCSLRDDGGGIYFYKNSAGTDAERTIEGNIIINGIGCNNGTDGTVNPNASGIYLDGYINNVTITSNTTANNSYTGVFLHNTIDASVHDNTSYNNSEGQICLIHDGYGPEIRNANVTRNIAFAKGNNFLNQVQKTIEYCTSTDDFTLFGTLDSNKYAAPVSSVPANALAFKTENSAYQGIFRTFAGWKSFIGKDANSLLSAITVPNTSYLRFEYNDTEINKTVVLDGTYIDINGTQYAGSITLLPFRSAVLIKIAVSGNQTPVIQNQSFQVNENSPNGTVVGTVVASDPDPGQTLTYSILSGNSNNAFSINASTGAITVANSVALNYEAVTSFALVIKIQDNGVGNLSNQATVTVNLLNVNEPPVIGNQAFSVNENSANGTALGSIIASDPDAGQTLTYSILSGNTNNAFAVNSSNGAITVSNSTALNFEALTSYTLMIKVQDNGTGNLSSQGNVVITILDVNEAPLISSQAFSVNENSANGTSVGSVIASDPDAGQVLTYSILSGNTNSAFSINATTGAIVVANSTALNFEVVTSFGLVIKVQDNGTGTLSSQATVTVNLINVNEAPVVNNQTFNVGQLAPVGTQVGTVVASDPDAGQTLAFVISSGNTSSAFSINSASGIITVSNSTALNFQTNPIFNLNVRVTDNGAGNLFKDATVTINVANTNQAPVIANQTFSLSENSPVGFTVGTVVSSDPNAGQTLTYSILSGNTSDAFAINATTGTLTVNNTAVLNFEVTPSFPLIIKVQDNGTPSLSSQATVTITLLNVNEPPAISNQAFSVNENSANGTALGSIIASDPDAGQTLTYSILSGNTNNAFAVNASNGAITVANSTALNYEALTSYTLIIKVQDNGTGSLSSQGNFVITLLNVNEVPVISNQAFSINENSANGTVAGNVVASDPDAGQILSYSILSGNTNSAFTINATTGAIVVANSTALNYEVVTSFGLVIKVQDNGTGTLSSQATVTVNLTNVNEPPVVNNQTFSIAHLAPAGTQAGTVVASDPDAGQTLSFVITSGNTSNAFSINSASGIITVSNSAAVNFQTNPTFNLNVRVTDNGTGNLYKDAMVTINVLSVNQAPVIANQTFSLSENSPDGFTVGTVVASDPNAGQTLTYSILSGNTGNAFAINISTGTLTVSNSVALNFEVTPSFALTIKVLDNGPGNLSSQATVTITLLNVNEPPVISNQSFSINENTSNGTVAGSVIASDPDAGQSVSYSIFSGNSNGAFAINTTSGALSVANMAALDFEAIPSFALVVKAQDNGTGLLGNQSIITVNLININEAPIISNQSLYVSENSPNGTLVGRIAASDPDAGQVLTYSILAGNTNNAFAINASDGTITVASTSVMNYETNPSFFLMINVKDNGIGNLSSQANTYITIINVNEPPVITNQSFPINENSANGITVGTIIATDPDAGQTLTYSILSGNSNNAFAINSSTGTISVANSTALNYEATPTFTLAVKVQDNGAGNLSSVLNCFITILDINEPPVISAQTFSVFENSPNGTIVGSILATDPDAGQTLTYSIFSGNINDAFAINAVTGVLSVNNYTALDFETLPSFTIVLNVQDNGVGSLNTQSNLYIFVLDLPETQVNATWPLTANISPSTPVGNITASDMSNGIGINSVTFSVGNYVSTRAYNGTSLATAISNNDYLQFRISPLSGNNLSVNTISLFRGVSAGSMSISVLYSTDATFSSYSTVGSISGFSNTTVIQNSYTGLNITVVDGQSLYVRIYGWNLGATNYFKTKAVVISGTTWPARKMNSPVITALSGGNNIGTPDNSVIPSNESSTGNQQGLNTNLAFERHDTIPHKARIFPNPVINKILNVELEGDFGEQFELTIIDMSGKSLMRRRFEQTKSTSLDLSEYPKGIYALQIHSSNFNFSDKFILK